MLFINFILKICIVSPATRKEIQGPTIYDIFFIYRFMKAYWYEHWEFFLFYIFSNNIFIFEIKKTTSEYESADDANNYLTNMGKWRLVVLKQNLQPF